MADEQPAASAPDPQAQAHGKAEAPPADKSIEAEQAKMMKVTSLQGWLSLAVVGGSIVALIVWGIVGSIPERIEGQGIVIRGGGLRQLRASGGLHARIGEERRLPRRGSSSQQQRDQPKGGSQHDITSCTLHPALLHPAPYFPRISIR